MANYIINECLTNDEYIVSAVTSLTVGEVIKFYIGEDNPFCGTVGEVTSSPVTPLSFYDSVYTDCCECLSGFTDSLNFKFIICDTLAEINIEATNFCSEGVVPTIGLTYEIQFDSYVPFCATFSGLTESGETNYHYSSGPFLDCELCTEPLPVYNLNVTATTCDGNSQLIILPGDVEFSESSIYQLPNGQCVSLTSGETVSFYANSMIIAGPFDDCDECAQPFSANTGGNNGEVCVIDCSGNTVTVTPPHPVYTNGQNQAIVQINAITIGGNGLNS
jgi:hypothetical protein